jgi:hypothetical protein
MDFLQMGEDARGIFARITGGSGDQAIGGFDLRQRPDDRQRYSRDTAIASVICRLS